MEKVNNSKDISSIYINNNAILV